MATLPLSDVKARLSDITEEVDRMLERVHITRTSSSWPQKTLSPSRQRWNCSPTPPPSSAQSQQEIARGEGLSLDQVEQLMAERSGKREA